MKIYHAIELCGGHSLSALKKYFEQLKEQALKTKVKATKNLVKDVNFKSAMVKCDLLIEKGFVHPKLVKLKEVVEKVKDKKILIFTQFRDQAVAIKKHLEGVVESRIFVGQAKKRGVGLSQKEQKKMIEDFKEGKFNCLIATSVAEEGLDIPSVDNVVFYEPVPSAIRTVQRRGRTGRFAKGRVSVLISKGTKDEVYRWSAHHKERRMYKVLKEIKSKSLVPKKENSEKKLSDFTRKEEENKIKIYVDSREKGSKIIREMFDAGVEVKLKPLDVGDYLLSDRVVVEFKTVEDFVNSIIDGRLLSQLRGLAKYEKPLILLQGEEDIYSVRKVHPNVILSMFSVIAVSYGIPLLRTKNEKESAALMMAIARKEQEEGGKEFQFHSSKPLSDNELLKYIVSSLPGIGNTLARPLLNEFKTIKRVVNAEVEDLKKVRLIGEEKAKRLKEIFEKEYFDEEALKKNDYRI